MLRVSHGAREKAKEINGPSVAGGQSCNSVHLLHALRIPLKFLHKQLWSVSIVCTGSQGGSFGRVVGQGGWEWLTGAALISKEGGVKCQDDSLNRQSHH